MSTRFAATLIATSLAFGGPAVFAAPTPASSGLTATSIENAVTAGTLAETLTQALGTEPTAEQLSQLRSALQSLAENSPSAAAKAASALVDLAWDNAADNPQTTVSQLGIAQAIFSDPAVAAAEPDLVQNGLAQVQGAKHLAERSAATQGIELSDTDTLSATGLPDDLVADAIALADAQADLAGFTTAAGGPDVGAAAANVSGETASSVGGTGSIGGAGGAASRAGFGAFPSAPGGGGGGGGVALDTQPVASPAG